MLRRRSRGSPSKNALLTPHCLGGSKDREPEQPKTSASGPKFNVFGQIHSRSGDNVAAWSEHRPINLLRVLPPVRGRAKHIKESWLTAPCRSVGAKLSDLTLHPPGPIAPKLWARRTPTPGSPSLYPGQNQIPQTRHASRSFSSGTKIDHTAQPKKPT